MGRIPGISLVLLVAAVVLRGEQPFANRDSVAAAARPAFTDITTPCGLSAIVSAHYRANPEWWLSGLHLVDLDGDGDLDLFLSAHGRGDALAAVNDGHGRFAVAAGTYPSREIHLCYDSDEDGKVDLTMTYKDGGGQWWRNRSQGAQLSFEPTGITRGTNTARRQALIDIDRDGNVDWLLWYEQVAIYNSQAAFNYYGLPATERHFGLGERTAVDIAVEFYPSGRVARERNVRANGIVEIRESTAAQ